MRKRVLIVASLLVLGALAVVGIQSGSGATDVSSEITDLKFGRAAVPSPPPPLPPDAAPLDGPGVLHIKARITSRSSITGEVDGVQDQEFWFDPDTEDARYDEKDVGGVAELIEIRHGLTRITYLADMGQVEKQEFTDPNEQWLHNVRARMLWSRDALQRGDLRTIGEVVAQGRPAFVVQGTSIGEGQETVQRSHIDKETGLVLERIGYKRNDSGELEEQGRGLFTYSIIERVPRSSLPADLFAAPNEQDGTIGRNLTLEDAKGFGAYAVYWTGPTAGGTPLAKIHRSVKIAGGEARFDAVVVVYAPAENVGNTDAGPEVEVFSKRPDRVYAKGFGERECAERVTAGGKQGVLCDGGEAGAQLLVELEGVHVHINAPNRELALQALGSLQKLNSSVGRTTGTDMGHTTPTLMRPGNVAAVSTATPHGPRVDTATSLEAEQASVTVYEWGRTKRYGWESETARSVTRALGRELQHTVREQGNGECGSYQDYIGWVKQGETFGDAHQEGIEVTYPEPGVRIGGEGPYTRIFILYRPDTTGTTVRQRTDNPRPILLVPGKECYATPISTRPVSPTAELSIALDAAFLRPPDRATPHRSFQEDAEWLREVTQDFLRAMAISAELRGETDTSREYERIARMHLTPELNKSIQDLGELGLLLPRSDKETVQVGSINHSRQIRGDWGRSSSELLNSYWRRQCVRMVLERRDGQWKISAIKTSKPEGDYTCGKPTQR